MSRRALKLVASVAALLALAGTAWAFWSTAGGGSAAASAGTLTAATISVPATSTGAIAVTWTQQATLPGNAGAENGIAYRVERRTGTGAFAPVTSGPCAGDLPHGTTSCTDAVTATGSYSYRVVADFAGGSWTATSNQAGPVAATVGIVDTTPPTVGSIQRLGNEKTNTSGGVQWTVTFSESVVGVDAADFALVNTGLGGTPTIAPIVSGSGSTYTVTASTGTGSGSLGLNLVDDDSIKDAGLNALGGTGTGNGNFTGQVFQIDRTAPTVSSIAPVAGAQNPTNASGVSWTVTFSEPVSGVEAGDFALANGGLGGTPAVTGVTPSATTTAATFTVTASTGSGSGTLGLNLVDDDSIADGATNKLGGAGAGNGGFTGAPYTLDRTAPALTALQMLDADTDGKVDRVTATFNESLVASTATAPWTLANVPSAGTLASLSTSGTTATLTLNEGAGAANTAVGTFTVALAASATGIRDALGNQSSLAATAPSDKAGPVPTTFVDDDTGTGGGNPHNGLFQVNDTLTVTFSEAIQGLGTTTTVTLTGGSGTASDTLSAPGFLAGTTALGGDDYIGGAGTVATFAGALAVVGGTQARLTLGACSGTCASLGQEVSDGSFTYTPPGNVADAAANAAAGSVTLSTRVF